MAHTYIGVGLIVILSLQFFSCEGEYLVNSHYWVHGRRLQAYPPNPLHAGIFVYRDNPYHGEQLAAASFSIGGKEYKDVIPYFTIGKLFPERESESCRFDLVGRRQQHTRDHLVEAQM